jgi:chorismate dehydratase
MLTVGTVPYRVARPLDSGLGAEPGIELVQAVPAELVRGLRAGELDVALVSAVELFRRPGYRFLDGWAVAGVGRVASVQVFLRRALGDVRRVALDPASRAAAALTQVVWPAVLDERPAFLELSAGADPRRADADAWLRIGDPALSETYAADAPPSFNPCERWVAETGMPFPFAVWVVRGGASAAAEDALGAFARARDAGAARLAELAAEVEERLGVPPDAARRYFAEEIDYAPGAALAPALRAFRDRAARLDLARADLAPEPIATPAMEAG